MAIFPADTPLSFAHLGALEVPPPQLIDLLDDAGFASTSLRMRGTGGGTPEYPLLDRHQRAETKARLQATGVEILYIELVSFGRHLAVDDLRPMFEIGAELGATRVLTAGDDDDFELIAAQVADAAELGREFGLAIDLEFMPFRKMRTLADSLAIMKASYATNVHVCIDALHFNRSGGKLSDLTTVPVEAFGTFQICDGPTKAPADLTYEARSARLLPGAGALDLRGLMAALPDGLPFGVEVPLAAARPDLSAGERIKIMADATRLYLAEGRSQA